MTCDSKINLLLINLVEILFLQKSNLKEINIDKAKVKEYILNLKIDVVPKASHAIVIRQFSLNEAPLGLFKFISDYLPYFEKINIFFNIAFLYTVVPMFLLT
jgi:hypothetical protein